MPTSQRHLGKSKIVATHAKSKEKRGNQQTGLNLITAQAKSSIPEEEEIWGQKTDSPWKSVGRF